MSISGLKPYNMIKFRLHMIPPSKKPWIARNRNQLAWMFPREILDNGEVTTLLCHANIRQQIKPVGSVTAIGAQNKISQ